jgi:lipid-binding SYLF domain-containing protein
MLSEDPMKSLAIALALSLGALACSSTREPESPQGVVSAEQRIVDRAADALSAMRGDPDFAALDGYLVRARGVLIFPRVIKAAVLFGGEGGNGVLVARTPDGGWSAPAFYSIGGGSVGLQLGYQEATLVLVLMNDSTLLSVIDGGLTLGADASVAAGTVGDTGAARGSRTAADIVQFVNVGGVFAGASFDGAVLEERDSFNRRFYGPEATTHGILIERKLDAPGADAIRRVLPTGS